MILLDDEDSAFNYLKWYMMVGLQMYWRDQNVDTIGYHYYMTI